jgi:hypothetical protein
MHWSPVGEGCAFIKISSEFSGNKLCLADGACNTVLEAGGSSENLSSPAVASTLPVAGAVVEAGAEAFAGSGTSVSCFIPEKKRFIKFNGISPDF